MYSNRKADSLSERVAALENERDGLFEAGRKMEFRAMTAESQLESAKQDRQAHIDWVNERWQEAEAALASARVEGAREALTRLMNALETNTAYAGPYTGWHGQALPVEVYHFRDREYPAPSAHAGERETPCHRGGNCLAPTVCATGGPCQYRPVPTPEPEIVAPNRIWLPVQEAGENTTLTVCITQRDAAAMAQMAAQYGSRPTSEDK